MIRDIKSVSDFETAIGTADTGLVVIDFSAEWCGPCKKIAPFIVTLMTKYPDVGFYKIDIDVTETKDIAVACQVAQIPTFCFFYAGNYVKSLIGADESKLDTTISNLLVEYANERTN